MKRILPTTYFDGSIKRMIMFSFMVVLLIPLGFSITSLFENSWSQAQQEMLEKHQLISEALVEPFTLFVSSRQKVMNSVGAEILSAHSADYGKFLDRNAQEINRRKSIQGIIDKYQKTNDDLAAVTFVASNNDFKSIAYNHNNPSDIKFPDYSELPLSLIKKVDSHFYAGDFISPVFTSTFSNKPVVLLRCVIKDKSNNEIGTISAEMSLKYIESMCSKINFGELGHCATVDQTGHVVAHPNKNWVKETRDLSNISVVKEMMAGKSGVTEFYSPFLKADMVAGYSSIPALGWGIMIPQPKAELTQSFDTIRAHTYLWLIAGIVFALFVANILMNKILSPINNLIKRTNDVNTVKDCIDLGTIPKNSPSEIRQLWKSFATLLTGLQESNKKVKSLNISLNQDIDHATRKLREMNRHLYGISNQDYVTSIANRRYFTTYLDKVLNSSEEESVGILAIDLDDFKQINDNYGHEVGDLALQHLSEILKNSTRKDDLVARLGGDEFVVYARDLDDKVLTNLADKIRLSVENNHVKFDDIEIKLTISIGVINYDKHKNSTITLRELLINADEAMYCSKQNGRNRVTFHQTNEKPEKKMEMQTITI